MCVELVKWRCAYTYCKNLRTAVLVGDTDSSIQRARKRSPVDKKWLTVRSIHPYRPRERRKARKRRVQRSSLARLPTEKWEVRVMVMGGEGDGDGRGG